MSGENVMKTKKKKKWPFVVLGVVAALIILVVALGNMAAAQLKDMMTNTVQQATAEKGSIVETVVGSGNLAYGDTQDIKIPEGIKIDQVLVEKGDYVKQGEVLATVDSTSVQTKLTSLKDSIDDLDEQINETKDDTASDVIKSHVSGRIKIISASEGNNAADVMIDAGSLMTISMDGKMAVDIESSASLSIGDEVKVTLADGSKRDGTIDRKTSGGFTVTLTDNGPKAGEKVSVADQDGNDVGKGTLVVNSPITIAGTGGTIDKIHVQENEKVSKGSKLITLSDVAGSAEHAAFLQQRIELMDSYQRLVAISKTGTITAQSSGTIENVNIEDKTVVSASSAAASQSSSSSGSGDSGSQDGSSYAQQMQGMGMMRADSNDKTGVMPLRTDLKASGTEAVALEATVPAVVEISDVNDLAITPPVVGAVPQKTVEAKLAYGGSILWQPADAVFLPQTSYMAMVTLRANAGYIFHSNIMPVIAGAEVSNVMVASDANGSILTFTVSYPATAAVDAPPTQQPDRSTPDMQIPDMSAYSGGLYGGMSLSSMGGSTGGGAAGQTATASETDAEVVAFTMATDGEMVLSIHIDELDILSVKEGMEVGIAFDAINNQEYKGTITKVADAAETSTGVAKYKADIHIARDDQMRAGMNATATIVIDEKDDILTIPVDALQERSGTVFVYTALDPETKLPTGETEVKTGLSDGNAVEIVEGLSQGQTVYYVMTTGLTELPFGMPPVPAGMGGTRAIEVQ